MFSICHYDIFCVDTFYVCFTKSVYTTTSSLSAHRSYNCCINKHVALIINTCVINLLLIANVSNTKCFSALQWHMNPFLHSMICCWPAQGGHCSCKEGTLLIACLIPCKKVKVEAACLFWWRCHWAVFAMTLPACVTDSHRLSSRSTFGFCLLWRKLAASASLTRNGD